MLFRSKSPLISAKLAMVALGNGDMAAAEVAAKSAMDGAPALAGPNVTLAEVMVRVGKPEEAKAPLARAIDINPFDPRIHHLTLAVLGEKGDPEARAHAERALALLQGAGKAKAPNLGKGGLVKVLGAPFMRVYLRRPGSADWIPTSKITPTSAISVKPGSYELMLLPVRGEATLHTIEVQPTSEDGQPQIIIPGATGS